MVENKQKIATDLLRITQKSNIRNMRLNINKIETKNKNLKDSLFIKLLCDKFGMQKNALEGINKILTVNV